MLSFLIKALVTLFVVLPIKLFVVLPAKFLGVGIRLVVWVCLIPLKLILLPIKLLL